MGPTALDCTWLLQYGSSTAHGQGQEGVGEAGGAGAGVAQQGGDQGGGQQGGSGMEMVLALPSVPGEGAQEDGQGQGGGGGAEAMEVDGEKQQGHQEEQPPPPPQQQQDGGGSGSGPGGEHGGGDLTAGPLARRLLIAASKPVGSIFVWRSGLWCPAAAEATATAAADGIAAGKEGTGALEGVVSRSLAAACGRTRGSLSCLVQGVHGTHHTTGVGLVAGQQLLVSGGHDGAVRCWSVQELCVNTHGPAGGGAAHEEAGAGGSGGGGELVLVGTGEGEGRRVAVGLQLVEVPDAMQRLDPATATQGLTALPPVVRSLPQSKQVGMGVGTRALWVIHGCARSVGCLGRGRRAPVPCLQLAYHSVAFRSVVH